MVYIEFEKNIFYGNQFINISQSVFLTGLAFTFLSIYFVSLSTNFEKKIIKIIHDEIK